MMTDPIFHLFRVTDRKESDHIFPKYFRREIHAGERWVRFRDKHDNYAIFYFAKTADPERVRYHRRDFYQIHWVVSGRGQRYIRLGESRVLQRLDVHAGDILLIPPSMSYHLVPKGPTFALLSLSFKSSFLGYPDELSGNEPGRGLFPLISSFHQTNPILTRFHPPDSIFRKMLLHVFQGVEWFHQGGTASMQRQLIFLMLEWIQLINPKTWQRSALSPSVEYALSHLRVNFREKIRLKNISTQLGLSPTYFSALFNRETGCTLCETVNRLRITEAIRLLSQTRSPIHRIALELGYEHVSHFNAVFRKLMGKVPSHHRYTVSR